MGRGKQGSDKVSASNFFKRPEVKRMVKLLTEAKEKAIVKATEEVYKKMFSEEIATELELDVFHTNVLRGKVKVEEVYPVREKTVKNILQNGKIIPMLEEKVLFKRVERLPSIKEKQFSAAELYKRNGSYKPFKLKVSDSQDDQEQAAIANNGVETIERYVILSSGEKIKMHG